MQRQYAEQKEDGRGRQTTSDRKRARTSSDTVRVLPLPMANMLSMEWMREGGSSPRLVSIPTTNCQYTCISAASWSSADATAPPMSAPSACPGPFGAPVLSSSRTNTPCSASQTTPWFTQYATRLRTAASDACSAWASSARLQRSWSSNSMMTAATMGGTETSSCGPAERRRDEV